MNMPITPLPPAQDQAQSNELLNTLPVCLQQNQLNKGKASLCSEPFPAPHVSLPRPSPLYLCPLAQFNQLKGPGREPVPLYCSCLRGVDLHHPQCSPPSSLCTAPLQAEKITLAPWLSLTQGDSYFIHNFEVQGTAHCWLQNNFQI